MLDQETKEIVRVVRQKSLEQLLKKKPNPTKEEEIEAFLYMLAGRADGEPSTDER